MDGWMVDIITEMLSRSRVQDINSSANKMSLLNC